MIRNQAWFERAFSFDQPVTAFPGIVERLRGTPGRLEERLLPLPEAIRTARHDDRWSIQENAGHLLDVEPIWAGRVDDLMASAERLREADLENRGTWEADHGARPVEEILAAFREARSGLVRKLDAMDEDDVLRAALHPRLEQPMRTLDLVFFVAEHDDHHLARITELMRALGV